jgi:hypothetical protein
MGGLVLGHEGIREQRVICVQHDFGEVSHYRLGLKMEVSKHLIRSPTTKEGDDIGINLAHKKRCGTGCAE